MKIVCDNCATKYSIADEKVRGKVFKIRCKKCSHIIVVRGTGPEGAQAGGSAEAAEPAAAADDSATMVASVGAPGTEGADGVWHLVIDREQVGPLTAEQVRAKFSAGQVDAETFAWREGFGDWVRLGSIDEFKDLAPSTPAGEVVTRRTDTTTSDLFGGAPDVDEAPSQDSGDLFGAPAAMGAEPATMPAAASPTGGEDVFSQGGGMFGAEEPAPARRQSPAFGVPETGGVQAASADGKMTGQRNESSVLFSLNNLSSLASGPAAAPDPRAGYANSKTEGSGLIDIRAMASTLSASSAGPQGTSKGEDVPAFSSAPMFTPMAAPILMPAAPTGMPKWMYGIFAMGGVAIIAIIIVGVLLFRKTPETTVVAAATPTPAGTTAAPAAGQPAAAPAAAAAAAAAAPAAAAESPEAAKATEPARSEDKSAGKSRRSEGKKSSSKGSSSSGDRPMTGVVPPPSEKPAAKPARKGGDDLDDLLNSATGGSSGGSSRREAAPAPAANENLPDALSKGDVVSGMGRVKPRVQGCYDQFKQPGTVMVHLTIGNNGKVSAANVTGAFAGTPTGDCVAKAVKTATFQRFKSGSLTIDYPFSIR